MSKIQDYISKTEGMLKDILEELQLELYDVEFVKEGKDYYLRIFIDKEGGVNITDCENVSRRMSAKLDEDDFISESYILEVSSPGLTRTLTKEKHFLKSIGKKVEVTLYAPIDGEKKFYGILEEYNKDAIKINADEKEMIFKNNEVALVKLALD